MHKIRVSCSLLVGALLVAPLVSADPDAKTVRLWKTKCASCHGVDGKGKTETGEKQGIPDMTAAAWQKKVDLEQAKKAILDGVKREGKEGMDPFREKLEAAQVDALAGYVKSLGK